MFLLVIIVTQRCAKRCVFPPQSDRGSRQGEAEAEEVVLGDQDFGGSDDREIIQCLCGTPQNSWMSRSVLPKASAAGNCVKKGSGSVLALGTLNIVRRDLIRLQDNGFTMSGRKDRVEAHSDGRVLK